jgi:hypothetical protein
MSDVPSIEQYLEKLAKFAGDGYGQRIRQGFADIEGASELAMLAAPTEEELAQLRRAVGIMTGPEKADVENLSDEQVQRIAADAHADPANLAIFFNGFVLHCKRVSRSRSHGERENSQ